MKFIVSSQALLRHLQTGSPLLNANSVLPILESFDLHLHGNTLTVRTTDLESVMQTELTVEGIENGAICIPGKVLLDALKNLADQPITLSVDKNYGVVLTTESGKYKVMGENPDNFPKAPQPDDTTAFTLPSSALVRGIAKTLFAVSNDDRRPAMTGVFFELSPTALQLVATDAQRLVRYTRTGIACPKEASFIVPKKPLTLLKGVLPDSDTPLTVSYNSSHLFVQHGTTLLSCRLIDANFPAYKVVIPQDNPYRLIVSKNGLQSALRRINVFTNHSTSQVALQLSGTRLQLQGQDVDFSTEGTEGLPCEYDGQDLTIAFNAKFLIEMLGATDGDKITVALSTPTKAGILRPEEANEGEDIMMLVMPLMLND